MIAPRPPKTDGTEYHPDGVDSYSGDPYWLVGLYRSPAERLADTNHLFGGRILYVGDRRPGDAVAMNGVPLGSLSLADAGRVARAVSRMQAWLLATGRATQRDLWPEGL